MIPKKKTTRTPKPTATTKAAAAPKAVAAPKPAARKGAPGRKRVPEATAANQPAMTVSDDDIRIGAYFLSLEYRGSNRNDVDFWLLAERELRGT